MRLETKLLETKLLGSTVAASMGGECSLQVLLAVKATISATTTAATAGDF